MPAADTPAALPTDPRRVGDLRHDRPVAFSLVPEAPDRTAIATVLGLLGLRKLRFEGEMAARGDGEVALTAQLGATVVQPCVVTLEPVTTRIDVPVARRFLRDLPEPAEDEVEMDPDETIELLGPVIDLAAVMIEALALNLPLYPRAEGADPVQAQAAPPGVAPLQDEDAKPFAGLASLRDALRDRRADTDGDGGNGSDGGGD